MINAVCMPQKIPLLQRLLADESTHNSIEHYIQTIKNDLQGLLNTFCSEYTWPHYYSELNDSLLNFGVPHFFKKINHESLRPDLLCEQIKLLIMQKEPRLHNTAVCLVEHFHKTVATLHMSIETELVGMLQVQCAVFQLYVNLRTLRVTLL